MAIPTKPLEIKFDPKKLTIRDIRLFSSAANDLTFAVRVADFLHAYCTSWTPEEIESIQMDELTDVGKQLLDKIKDIAVPKGKSKGSKSGRRSKTIPLSQSG